MVHWLPLERKGGTDLKGVGVETVYILLTNVTPINSIKESMKIFSGMMVIIYLDKDFRYVRSTKLNEWYT